MKNTILFVLFTLMVCAANAQTLIVYGVSGNVEDVTAGNPKPIKLRDVLLHSTKLRIPENGYVVLFDKENTKSITLEQTGTATIKSMISGNSSSIKELTAEFVSFLWKQITNGGQVRVRNSSDVAAVTRDLKIAIIDANDDLVVCGTENQYSSFLRKRYDKSVAKMKDKYNESVTAMKEKYNTFRDSIFQNYANFVREPWKKAELSPAEIKPEDEKIEPIVIEEKNRGPIIPDFDKKDKMKEAVISILPLPMPLPIPELMVPVEENHDVTQYRSFILYGTKMKVRWSDDCAFHLKSLKEKAIADVITQLFSSKYDNLLYDCLQLRSNYHLSDWAYYLMLKELSASFCGKDTNEATLLHAMLFSRSGYGLRLAKAKDRLLLLVSTQFHLYGYSYLTIDGSQYYQLDGDDDIVDFCEAKFPIEQEMSLIMTDSPRFVNDNSELRAIASPAYSQYKAQVSVNKNLIDFYSAYPTSYFNNNFMTRWAMYANAEMQPEVREQLYPQLREMIKGKSQQEGTESILNWIQTAFKYEYDKDVWGHDRAFFAEESLYYPSCDCEDRSILFTRLVRDILGLKCILVHYPGHLASGVCFTEKVEGDYIDVEDNRYTICDPTFIIVDGNHNIIGGAHVGESMFDNSEATVIVLE